MYPLLYEAAMTLRTTAKDATLRQYIQLEYGGTAPAWLFARRKKSVRRVRATPALGFVRRLFARRPEPADPAPSA